jgi:hypothetical protein
MSLPVRVGFLACLATLPGSPVRRADAFEHDLQVAALRPALAARGIGMVEIMWAAPLEHFAGIELVLIGTSWDYQDRKAEFLTRLDELAGQGVQVCNPPDLVRWNIEKTYLRDLAQAGLATIPTVWLDEAGPDDIAAAFDHFGTDSVVIKRQVGAGAQGQQMFSQQELPAADWRFDRPAMIQPFQRSIQNEGEYSFLFFDGAFSHAVLKHAPADEYRIQSLFGGTETAHQPSESEVATAAAGLAKLPFAVPLYARVDMLRLDNGTMAAIEVEMIEPFLYPVQGPRMGEFLAEGIARRLAQKIRGQYT